MGAQDSLHSSDAERLFEAFLEEGGQTDQDLAAFIGRHPAQALELRRLFAQFCRLAAWGRPADEGVAPTARELDELNRWRAAPGRYEFVALIDRGGMGEVWRVRDHALKRDVAMKLMRVGAGFDRPDTADPHVARRMLRFLGEARTLGALDHPGIVPIHDGGIDAEGRLYFTMPVVAGQTLRSLMEAGSESWPLERTLRVLIAAAEAVAFAHAHGVVHRDLKPSNIMIGQYGEAYVMDWGIAKLVGDSGSGEAASGPGDSSAPPVPPSDDARHPLTARGVVLGTAPYMSPEQASGGNAPIGPGADIYSLGAILYQALAGHPPFRLPGTTPTDHEIVERLRLGPPPRLGSLRRDLPLELVAVCEQAMAREPSARYADARQLADDLGAYLEGREGRAWKDRLVVRAAKWVRRHPAQAVSSAAGVAIVLLLTIAAVLWRARDVTEARNRHLIVQEQGRNLSLSLRDLTENALTDRPTDGPQVDHLAICSAMAAAFTAAGLDLRAPDAPSRISAYHDALADPAVQLGIRNGLWQLSFRLVEGGRAHADRLSQGWTASWVTPEALQAWQRVDERAPQLAGLYDAVRATLEAVDSDPYRRRMRAAEERWWFDRTSEVDGLVDEARRTPVGANEIVLLIDLMREMERDTAELRGLLELAVERNPDNFWAHFKLAGIAGSFAERQHHNRTAVALRPDSSWARFNLAWSYQYVGTEDEVQGNKPLAIAAYKEALRLNPGLSDAYWHLAKLAPAETSSLLEQSLLRVPPTALLFLALGEAYANVARLDQAANAMRRGIALFPDDVKLHYNLSQYLAHAGDNNGQIAALEDTLEIAPDTWEALTNLGMTLLARSYEQSGEAAEMDQARALSAAQRALALRPDDPTSKWNLCTVYFAQDDFERSLPLLEGAVAGQQSDAIRALDAIEAGLLGSERGRAWAGDVARIRKQYVGEAAPP